MHKFRMILPVLLIGCLMYSCNLINPSEETPAYINIDTVFVRVNDFDKGAATHQISNIWLTVGNTALGTFEMPFTVPSLKTGIQELFIRPGIRVNGIAMSRIVYPFFEPYRITIDLVPGKMHTIIPEYEYVKDKCKFPWIEEFEDAGVSFIYSQYTDTTFRNQTDTVRSGRYSGAVYLNAENRFFEATGPMDFILPRNSVPILFEFDYLNSVGFEIGLYVMEDGAAIWNSLVFVKANPVWKRFYVDLQTTVGINPNAEAFRIGLRAEFDSTGTSKQGIILDNVKLIHF